MAVESQERGRESFTRQERPQCKDPSPTTDVLRFSFYGLFFIHCSMDTHILETNILCVLLWASFPAAEDKSLLPYKHTHTCTPLKEATGVLSSSVGSFLAICASDLPLPCSHSCSSKMCSVCVHGGNAGKQLFAFFLICCLIITASLFILKGPM